MLAFWGGVENSPVDPTLKSFIFVGKYLERVDLYTRFGYSMEELKAPLGKLASYIMPLNGLPVPQCFADGLRWLVGQLPPAGMPILPTRSARCSTISMNAYARMISRIWEC